MVKMPEIGNKRGLARQCLAAQGWISGESVTGKNSTTPLVGLQMSIAMNRKASLFSGLARSDENDAS